MRSSRGIRQRMAITPVKVAGLSVRKHGAIDRGADPIGSDQKVAFRLATIGEARPAPRGLFLGDAR